MNREIITIAGRAGSGKSSTAKLLAESLSWDRYSSGDFMRSIASERGVSLLELQKLAETDHSIDHEIDERNKALNDKDRIVVDARLAWYFIPNSFKVFLDLPIEVSAQRIFNDLQNNPLRTGEEFKSLDEVIVGINDRISSNHKRYQDLYQIDYADHYNFDLVIDTEKNNLDKVVSLILKSYQNWIDTNTAA